MLLISRPDSHVNIDDTLNLKARSVLLTQISRDYDVSTYIAAGMDECLCPYSKHEDHGRGPSRYKAFVGSVLGSY